MRYSMRAIVFLSAALVAMCGTGGAVAKQQRAAFVFPLSIKIINNPNSNRFDIVVANVSHSRSGAFLVNFNGGNDTQLFKPLSANASGLKVQTQIGHPYNKYVMVAAGLGAGKVFRIRTAWPKQEIAQGACVFAEVWLIRNAGLGQPSNQLCVNLMSS